MRYNLVNFLRIEKKRRKGDFLSSSFYPLERDLLSAYFHALLIFQVLETNRAEESQSHVHRMYFMGPNTFSEPWHLPHSPPEQVKEIV